MFWHKWLTSYATPAGVDPLGHPARHPRHPQKRQTLPHLAEPGRARVGDSRGVVSETQHHGVLEALCGRELLRGAR